MEYPKINSLYKRQFTTVDPVTGQTKYLDKGKSGNKLIEGDYACKEFGAINAWSVTEKVDGTNIRIEYKRSGGDLAADLTFHGRTERAAIPSNLFKYLQKTFTCAQFQEAFGEANHVILFGEGYGGQIQLPPGKQHNPYGQELSFILFDVFVDGWWLCDVDVQDLAEGMGIKSVPLLEYIIERHTDANNPEKDWHRGTYTWTIDQIVQYIKSKPKSRLGEHVMEGIVARSSPPMYFRDRPVISTSPLVHADYHLPVMFKLKCKDFDGMS